jgi:hypothetical protein
MKEEEEKNQNVFLFNFNLKPMCRRLLDSNKNALELPFLWHE